MTRIGLALTGRLAPQEYRRAGLALPILSPRAGGPDPKRAMMDAIRACAPGAAD